MGRSLATQTDLFNTLDIELREYRRALRIIDQVYFDNLLVYARKHLTPAGFASDLYPLEIFLLSISLEQEKNVQNLENLYKKFFTLYENMNERISRCEKILNELKKYEVN